MKGYSITIIGFIALLFQLFIISTQSGLAVGLQEKGIQDWSNYGILEGWHPTNNLCGVKSIFITLKDFGINADYKDILAEVPPGIYGNSMEQIVEYLGNNSDLEVKPVRYDSGELYRELRRRSNSNAIVNLIDHWVVVRRATDNTFEIIDYPRKYFVPIDAMNNLWDGYATIVHKRSSLLTWRRFGAGILFLSIIGIVTIILYRHRKKQVKTGKTRTLDGLIS